MCIGYSLTEQAFFKLTDVNGNAYTWRCGAGQVAPVSDYTQADSVLIQALASQIRLAMRPVMPSRRYE